jgi:hypothetical protein
MMRQRLVHAGHAIRDGTSRNGPSTKDVIPANAGIQRTIQKGNEDNCPKVDFWRESIKPPFDSLQSFLGFHVPSGIIARSAISPGLTKN